MPISTLSPLGFAVTAPSALASPSPFLADNIDPNTRDFRSMTTGSDPTDDAVQFAIGVVRGTGAAVVNDGMAPVPSKLDDSTAGVIDSDARAALAHLQQLGDVRVKKVGVDVPPGIQSAVLYVEYVNLRAPGQEVRTARITPRTLTGAG